MANKEVEIKTKSVDAVSQFLPMRYCFLMIAVGSDFTLMGILESFSSYLLNIEHALGKQEVEKKKRRELPTLCVNILTMLVCFFQ